MAQADDDEHKKPSEERTELADLRTDLAEDRTLLANERTFAGWTRTSLAAVGIGVGFGALFRTLEPIWLPKAIATAFLLIGIWVVVMAERRACAVKARLDNHKVDQIDTINLRLIMILIVGATVSLIAGIWIVV